MPAYSIPGSAFAMGDGRCYINFVNPNGSMSRYFSNWTADQLIAVDSNFVNPPSNIWSEAQGLCTAPLATMKAQQDYASQYIASHADQIATESAAVLQAQAEFNAETGTIQGNNQSNASGGSTPGSGTGGSVGSIFDGFMVGLQSILSPGDWMTIIQSGNIGAIAGLVAVPIVAVSLIGGKKHR